MIVLTMVFMTAMGAMFGALMRDEYLSRRKRSLELESKTPYDYALANARADNNRYRDELFTIKALKRTEADTKRIRIEIGTILSDDVEEATEDVYERNIGMPIRDNGDGTFSPILFPCTGMSTEEAAWDAGAVARAYQANVREDEEPTLYRVKSGDTLNQIAREHGTTITNIEKVNGKGSLHTFSVGDVIKLPTADRDVERSLTKAVRDSFENKERIRVSWEDSPGSPLNRYGIVDEIKSADGKVIYFGIKGTYIPAIDVTKITKGVGFNGETLYRKGNR